jgi:outer membrane receptor protein involved in Fe transport
MRGTTKWFLLVLVLALAYPAAAQVQFGTFVGTVTDASDAVIPGAKVTATNVGTGLKSEATTDSTGRYRFSELPPGRYKISVSASGFKISETSEVVLNAGAIARVDIKLEIGSVSETLTVESTPALIQTEDSRLSETVQGSQVVNLPLNGRNVFDLIKMVPGANDVRGVSFENGNDAVINGLRPNFTGFLINGSSNKGLSGGAVTLPNPDIVEEFQMLTLNVSAQYGNSASAVTNLVTKSGTNEFHGSAFWFTRHDEFDATDFFLNQVGAEKQNLQFNQFGGTITGPIMRDKLFFTASWQAERFITSGTPVPFQVESAEWRQAVTTFNPNSVASLLYNTFTPVIPGTPSLTLDQYVPSYTLPSMAVVPDFSFWLCQDNWATRPGLSAQFANLLGVTANDQAVLTDIGCSVIPALQAGTANRSAAFLNNSVAIFSVQEQNNLFDGNEWSTRIDYVRQNDRFFGEFYWLGRTDVFGPEDLARARGTIVTPRERFLPNFQASWVHTFSPTMINEAKVGFLRNRDFIDANFPGVPDIQFDDTSIVGFGAYNGYPQFFIENIYTYSDMLSWTKGNHNMKMGVEFRRNIENSEFNVARPSYYFFDPIFFAVDAPYSEVGGVDPGFVAGVPPELATNARSWRNLEVGLFFQNDWKVTRNFTLNLGLRYDLYTRHVEQFNRVTTFTPGPLGTNPVPTNAGFQDWILNANEPAGTGTCVTPQQINEVVLAGVCGPGGFATAKSLGGSDHNNFGPRVGFAWDVFGNGKTSLRGGFGLSYEGTLFNPLSNSRWNPPFYSFNLAFNDLVGDTSYVMYGPTTCTATTCTPDPLTAPTFTGAGTNPGQGVGAQAEGNLTGWAPFNPNQAFLTGIVFPRGIKDPYVTNYYLSVQHEILPKTVLEVNYVGTQGFNLFKAEQVNRTAGSRLPCPVAGADGVCNTGDDTGPLVTHTVQGRTLTALGRLRMNPNYGRLRAWTNSSESNYNALQISVRKQMSHGFMFNANYTWSHSIDNGSTWHSGATSANGAAAGDGYSTDPREQDLDRGNSIFDIRHRLQFNYVWELPWYRDQQGFAGHVLGGWQFNGIWTFQSGAHWSPWVSSAAAGIACTNPADITTCVNGGGDFNLDGEPNDRPDAPNGIITNPTTAMWANGFFNVPGSQFGCGWSASGTCNGLPSFFTSPCVGCVGNLGRNTFIGPSLIVTDMSIFKNVRITERVKFQFRFEMFNAFNHTNFRLPNAASGGNGGTRANSGVFGQAHGTQGPRQIQFGLKLIL